ncbi:MAG: metal-sulfur cluster assembly factor [Chloroflexi bacterium]|nr:metal-sulfur cluster assembly factor [Chloroflexota bacterium]
MSEERVQQEPTEQAEQKDQGTEETFDVTPDDIRQVLKEHVFDPEIGINIVDLGLVYDIKVIPEERRAIITMTLTSPGCPVGPQILAAAEYWVRETFPQLKDVEIELVWSPLWNPSMMSDEAKDLLGIF